MDVCSEVGGADAVQFASKLESNSGRGTILKSEVCKQTLFSNHSSRKELCASLHPGTMTKLVLYRRETSHATMNGSNSCLHGTYARSDLGGGLKLETTTKRCWVLCVPN